MPNIREDLIESNKIFEDDFVAEYAKFDISMQETNLKNRSGKVSKKLVKKFLPVIYSQDPNAVVDKLNELRDSGNLNFFHVKIFIDDGREKLKVSFALVPKVYDPSKLDGAAKKFLESFKVTGVKRILILAIAPVKETSDNLRVLLDKLQMSNWAFEYKLCCDLSCINKLLGMGNHRSMFPCYICEWNMYACGGATKGAPKRTFKSIKGATRKF